MTEVTQSVRGELIVGYQGRVTVLTLAGEHDTSTAYELRAAIKEHAERGRGVVVNLAHAEFIDSSIVYALVEGESLLLRKGRSLVLHLGAECAVDRVLELSGLLENLSWSVSLDEAVVLAGPDEDLDLVLTLRARTSDEPTV